MKQPSKTRVRPARTGVLGLVALSLAWTAACSSAPEEPANREAEESHVEGIVALDSAAMANVGLEVVDVSEVMSDVLSATGTILYDQNRVSHVGPKAEGRVMRIERDLGDEVRTGTSLAVMESPELGEAEAAHEQARVELELARENHERELGLFEKGISSRKEMIEARTEFRSREAAFAAATARHRTLGAVDHRGDSVGLGGLYTLSSPIPGTVVERNIVLGQIVGPADDLFTVADLTRLWIVLDIYDRDLARVRQGLSVEIRTTAFADESFEGVLTYLGQVVDPTTRTVKARVEIDNPERTLRPGMFATAVIRGLETDGALAVPHESLQLLEGRTVVFVPAGPDRFEMRDVTTGSPVGDDRVTVLGGLSVGDRVVSRGSFYLKSELLKESFGGGGH